VNFNNYFIEQFGSFEYKHLSTIFLNVIQEKHKNNHEKMMFVYMQKDNFQMIVLKEGKLFLHNHFSYKTKEDFIYYARNILGKTLQLSLTRNGAAINITGSFGGVFNIGASAPVFGNSDSTIPSSYVTITPNGVTYPVYSFSASIENDALQYNFKEIPPIAYGADINFTSFLQGLDQGTQLISLRRLVEDSNPPEFEDIYNLYSPVPDPVPSDAPPNPLEVLIYSLNLSANLIDNSIAQITATDLSNNTVDVQSYTLISEPQSEPESETEDVQSVEGSGSIIGFSAYQTS
jgi:hypothetical protein